MLQPDRQSSTGVQAPEFSLLIEKSADGIIVVDRDGIVLFANPAAERIFGRQAQELNGLPVGLPLLTGESVDIAVLLPDGGRTDVDMRVVETIWLGSPALLANLRDMTSQRAMEAQFRQAQKMEAMGQLTAGVAHDFNNILMSVLGNLELALPRVFDERARRLLSNAQVSANRAAKLTAHLLAFSRKQELRVDSVDVSALVEGANELLRRTIDPAVAIVVDKAEPGLWFAAADTTQVELILLNLGLNARDAMPTGGTLRLAARNISAGDPNLPADVARQDCVAVMVTDTGTGMSDAVKAQAFEPFFTTKEVGKGSGLGLSVVFGVMKQLGGSVQIDTQLGRGTSVSLFFPRATSEPHQATPDVPTATPGTGRILLVDDDAAVREVTEAGLQSQGYDVTSVEDARAALQIIETDNPIDLLITDLAMPGLSGTDLISAARRLRPDLPVLIVTGYGRTEGGAFDGILRKPFTLAGLAVAVQDLLRTRRKLISSGFSSPAG